MPDQKWWYAMGSRKCKYKPYNYESLLEAHKLEQGVGKGIWSFMNGFIVCLCIEGTGTNEEDDDEYKG
jgi:hypothetical protein